MDFSWYQKVRNRFTQDLSYVKSIRYKVLDVSSRLNIINAWIIKATGSIAVSFQAPDLKLFKLILVFFYI